MIETQTIERLKKMAARMKTAQDKILAETFKQMNFEAADNPTIVKNLLALSDKINNCAQAREIHKNLRENLQLEEYVRIAIFMVELSEYLSEDDCKLVFREVLHNKGLIKLVHGACENPILKDEAMELLWFITDGAPLYYWTVVDAMTEGQDCWSFQQVHTAEEFRDLLRQGKMELVHEHFEHIRICYGTKSFYYDPNQKEAMLERFEAISDGKEEFYSRAMNILFPDKYTIGNYYIYIPTR